jgi:putative N6-adenine-specific DNA methylase
VDTLPIFAVAAPGLEPVVTAELETLGLRASAERGGTAWTGAIDDVARANLELRTASRVLVRALEFGARTFHELERGARRVEWDRFVASNETIRLRVTCRKSALYHEGAVAERVLDAVEERTGRRGVTGAGDDEEGDNAAGPLFVVRMFRDICTISADSSGELLHRRGYREALAGAPLRETIAAAMLRASGWTPDLPLIDPLCGSGTIAIEAALVARGIAPGLARADRTPRAFRFLEWPSTDSRGWNDIVDQATTRIRARCPAPVLASDRNAGAIRAATANAERAGVSADIDFATRPLSAIDPPANAGWIITNPPYGERVGNRADARRILHELDGRLAGDFNGWSLAALVAGTPADALFKTNNGGIAVSLRLSGRAAG